MIGFLIHSIISMYHWLLFVNIPSSKAAGIFPAAIWHHIQLWLPAPALYCFPVYPGQMLLYPAKLPGDSVLRHARHLRDLFLHIGARYHKFKPSYQWRHCNGIRYPIGIFLLITWQQKSRQISSDGSFPLWFMKFNYLILIFTPSFAMRIHNSKPEEL